MLDEVVDDPRYSEPGCGVAYGQKLKTGGGPRTSCRELTGDNVSVLEPQDVKVIFDPVEYVVLDGMTNNALRQVLLMSEQLANLKQERIQTSIQETLTKGNVEFATLRITEEGNIEMES